MQRAKTEGPDPRSLIRTLRFRLHGNDLFMRDIVFVVLDNDRRNSAILGFATVVIQEK